MKQNFTRKLVIISFSSVTGMTGQNRHNWPEFFCQQHFCVLGDMNINIDYNRRTSTATNYINELISCGAIPVISIPTRVLVKHLPLLTTS